MRTVRTGLAALVAVLCTGCWTQAGFGPTRTGAQPFEYWIDTGNVDQLEEAWRATVGSHAREPIVLGDRVITSGGSTTTALDVGTGDVDWTVSHVLACDPPVPECTPIELALGTPALSNGRALTPWYYGPFGGVFSYDLHTGEYTSGGSGITVGSMAIRNDVTAVVSGEFGGGFVLIVVTYGANRGLLYFGSIGSLPSPRSPMLLGERVYVSAGPNVFAFDLHSCIPTPVPNTCAPAWVRNVGTNASMPVAVDENTLAVGGDNGSLVVLDAATGTIDWTGTTGITQAAAPAVAGGTIIVGTWAGKAHAFDAAGCGTPVCTPEWTGDAVASIPSQPAIANGVVYVGTTSGTVVAFDAMGCGASTCPSLWTGTTATGPTIGAVTGGPVVAGGHVYVGTGTGQLVAFGLLD